MSLPPAAHLPSLSIISASQILWAQRRRVGKDLRPTNQASAHQKDVQLQQALRQRMIETAQSDIDELSDNENDMDRKMEEIKTYGYSWMVPIGKFQSQEDEADDADLHDDEPSPRDPPRHPHPQTGGTAQHGEETGNADEAEGSDLDAEMDDRDDSASDGDSEELEDLS